MSFGAGMRRYVASTKNELDRRIRRIGLATYQQINERSPVVQGTFRANWNVSFDTIDRSFDPELKIKDFPARETIASATIFSGVAIGTVLFISNSTPYAQRLENGYSPRRPEGVVKPTVEAITRAINAGEFNR